jgi:hypothetical protein
MAEFIQMAKKAEKKPKKKKKKGRGAIGALAAKAKKAKTKKNKKPAKKAASPKPARKKLAALLQPAHNLDAVLAGAAGAPTVRAVDDCVKAWLDTWLSNRTGNSPLSAPFPSNISPEELDGKLVRLHMDLLQVAPAFDGEKYVNGDELVQKLGEHGSISYFIHLVYYYALRACGLRA